MIQVTVMTGDAFVRKKYTAKLSKVCMVFGPEKLFARKKYSAKLSRVWTVLGPNNLLRTRNTPQNYYKKVACINSQSGTIKPLYLSIRPPISDEAPKLKPHERFCSSGNIFKLQNVNTYCIQQILLMEARSPFVVAPEIIGMTEAVKIETTGTTVATEPPIPSPPSFGTAKF